MVLQLPFYTSTPITVTATPDTKSKENGKFVVYNADY
jgi:hypothetical protein